MDRKIIANIVVPILIIIIAYIVFGLFIINDQRALNDMVQGYNPNFSQSENAQAKGADLIKSNWQRVRSDNRLMQRQVDQSKISQ